MTAALGGVVTVVAVVGGLVAGCLYLLAAWLFDNGDGLS